MLHKKKGMKSQGTRLQVYLGHAKRCGTLTKNDLIKNKRGRIVSKARSTLGKKMYKNPLVQNAFKKKQFKKKKKKIKNSV